MRMVQTVIRGMLTLTLNNSLSFGLPFYPNHRLFLVDFFIK